MFVFDWDPKKAAANRRKHGITFEEAATTFFDLDAVSYPDERHSTPSDLRVIHIGTSTKSRLLFVVHNEEDDLIRIISARPVSPSERVLYEND